ncbi:1006_t:CDS:2 [Paraglomus occultum]|uniref:AP complex subunit sigma n=1 Tax=Paraglomus occultum TaxID=144539 RepID=A0A9N8YY01_9GLOM|nr:1006_t:CDS:2 [Paraglomus occultum]
MIRFFLLVNKQGQTRFSRYYTEFPVPPEEREVMEAEISRRCLKRGEQQDIQNRRYASLFFLIGFEEDENEFAILEFVQAFVETLNTYFDNVVSRMQIDLI